LLASPVSLRDAQNYSKRQTALFVIVTLFRVPRNLSPPHTIDSQRAFSRCPFTPNGPPSLGSPAVAADRLPRDDETHFACPSARVSKGKLAAFSSSIAPSYATQSQSGSEWTVAKERRSNFCPRNLLKLLLLSILKKKKKSVEEEQKNRGRRGRGSFLLCFGVAMWMRMMCGGLA
jgi:hypothetical protein